MSTLEEPERNSRMMTSRVFWSMSPCVALTVWSRSRILSVSQSTYMSQQPLAYSRVDTIDNAWILHRRHCATGQ